MGNLKKAASRNEGTQKSTLTRPSCQTKVARFFSKLRICKPKATREDTCNPDLSPSCSGERSKLFSAAPAEECAVQEEALHPRAAAQEQNKEGLALPRDHMREFNFLDATMDSSTDGASGHAASTLTTGHLLGELIFLNPETVAKIQEGLFLPLLDGRMVYSFDDAGKLKPKPESAPTCRCDITEHDRTSTRTSSPVPFVACIDSTTPGDESNQADDGMNIDSFDLDTWV